MPRIFRAKLLETRLNFLLAVHTLRRAKNSIAEHSTVGRTSGTRRGLIGRSVCALATPSRKTSLRYSELEKDVMA